MTLDSRRRRGQSARRIGYARVSTEDQNLALQLDALKRVGCEIIFKDKGVSGLSHSRPGLDKALAALGRGSDFVIWAVDRLGRDMGHLNRTAREFREQGIGFQSVCEHIDLETPEGRLNFNIRAAYAEYERDVISTRTKAGMAAAKARGIRLGRPRKLSEGQIARARKQVQRDGQEVRKIARKLGVSPVTLARALKEETA